MQGAYRVWGHVPISSSKSATCPQTERPVPRQSDLSSDRATCPQTERPVLRQSDLSSDRARHSAPRVANLSLVTHGIDGALARRPERRMQGGEVRDSQGGEDGEQDLAWPQTHRQLLDHV